MSELSYEEAMLALAVVEARYRAGESIGDTMWPDAALRAKWLIEIGGTAMPDIRAALARGPQGKGDVIRVAGAIPLGEPRTSGYDATQENGWNVKDARDEWKSRALAAEAEWAAEKSRFLEEKHRLGVAESKLRAAEEKVKDDAEIEKRIAFLEAEVNRLHECADRRLSDLRHAEAKVKELTKELTAAEAEMKIADADLQAWRDEALELRERLRVAQTKVKALEARLTDAALVEAGWVPTGMFVPDTAQFLQKLWLSRNAQQAKGGS